MKGVSGDKGVADPVLQFDPHASSILPMSERVIKKKSTPAPTWDEFMAKQRVPTTCSHQSTVYMQSSEHCLWISWCLRLDICYPSGVLAVPLPYPALQALRSHSHPRCRRRSATTQILCCIWPATVRNWTGEFSSLRPLTPLVTLEPQGP